MFTLEIENARGERLALTQNEAKFQVYEITGLNPPSATLVFSENINDGGEYVHDRTSSRNVVINLQINGDVEANRLELYKYVQTGKYVKLYLTTKYNNVWIEGRVETVEVNNFDITTQCQISIICPDPWWKDIKETINSINTIQPKFVFPFAIVNPIPFSTYEKIQILNLINKGNASSGMTIEISARGSLVNPIIYNRQTKEFIGFGTAEKPFEMESGDKIVISTYQNRKTVKLIRNAEETNIFNYLIPNSKFLQVEAGDNVFTYSADSGDEYIDITFKHYSNYKGV